MSLDIDLQRAEVREIFELFDKNSSGRVSVSELGTIVRALGLNPTEAEVLEMIKRVDVQGIGSFALKQLEDLVKEKEKEINPNAFKELVEALRVFDSDKDGFLSAEEFKHAMMTMGEKMQEYEIDEIVNDSELVQNKQIKIETFATLIMNRV